MAVPYKQNASFTLVYALGVCNNTGTAVNNLFKKVVLRKKFDKEHFIRKGHDKGFNSKVGLR